MELKNIKQLNYDSLAGKALCNVQPWYTDNYYFKYANKNYVLNYIKVLSK